MQALSRSQFKDLQGKEGGPSNTQISLPEFAFSSCRLPPYSLERVSVDLS